MVGGAKTIAKNTVFLYIRMILVMAVSLYTSRITLKVLGFEDFGLYNVVGSVVVFLSFLQYALRNATSRYITFDLGLDDREKLNRTYSMAINTHVLLAVIMIVLLEIGGVWFLNHKLNIAEDRLSAANWVFQLSLASFCIGIVRTPFESNILAHEKMDFYAYISIFEVMFKLLAVFLLLLIPYDKLIVYSFLYLIVSVIIFSFYVIYCLIKLRDCVYSFIWDKETITYFSKYSGWSILVNGAYVINTQSISIFFNLFLGLIANAAMGIANQVISALNMFVRNFTQAFRPQIIKSWAAQDYDYFYKILYITSKISYILFLIVCVPVFCNIDIFLGIWLHDYPPVASVYIELIILYYLIDSIQEPLVVAVHATGNLRFHQIMIAVIVLIFIPISYLLLEIGFDGSYVLIASFLMNVICAVFRTIYMRKLIKLDIFEYMKKVIIPMLVVTILVFPLSYFVSKIFQGDIINTICVCLFSVITILVASFAIGLEKSEKRILYNMPVVKKIISFL